jgi:hypothetical protein
MTEQFVSYLAGAATKAELPSLIEDHRVPMQIMSGLYRSHVLRQRGIDCVVKMGFGASYPRAASTEAKHAGSTV